MRASTVILAVWFLFPTVARADGGTVRISERSGPYRITVFTSPTPLRSGPADLSVFVQDADTGQPILDLHIRVALTAANGAGPVLRETASSQAATNKLFQAATCELGFEGAWKVQVDVEGERGPAAVSFEVMVEPSLPRISDTWFWIALPAVAVGWFIFQKMTDRARVARLGA